MKCPNCTNGKQSGFVDRRDGTGGLDTWTCDRCVGTGEVDDRQVEWMRLGEKCRAVRLARLETMRKFAARTRINVTMISRWECGYEDPAGHPDYEEATK